MVKLGLVQGIAPQVYSDEAVIADLNKLNAATSEFRRTSAIFLE